MASRIYLRVVFVLIGAALALAFALLDVTLIALLVRETSLPVGVVVVLGVLLVVLPVVLLGVVPVMRTLQGAAVHSLLGIALAGGPPGPAQTWPQRRRTLAWFVVHLLCGAVLVTAVMATLGYGRGWWVLPMTLGVVAVALGLGVVLTALAPSMLGPSYAERLDLLERSVSRTAERNRLAREIHDSVGHALSLVTVQAAAARTVIDRDRDFAVSALTAIEAAARDATADLDHVLGLLREESPSQASAPGPDLRSLEHLVAATREAGLTLTYGVDGELTTVPPLVSREAYRIVQEGLTNALRHSADGTARLDVARSDGSLRIRLRNPGGPHRSARAGRGLRGIGERVSALGGELTADGDLDGWTLEARLPLGAVAR